MVGIRAISNASEVASLTKQEVPLLSIDYAQGCTDLNFVFFYSGQKKRHRLPISTIKESLLKVATEQFPVLLGHICKTNDREWKIIVDPDNINWPVVTELHAKKHRISQCRQNNFNWKMWPQETEFPDLHTYSSQPMIGVYIVRYACGGISLHTKVRHQCMDGNGVWRFYNAWSDECRIINGKRARQLSAISSELPILDRWSLLSKVQQANSPAESSVGAYMHELGLFLKESSMFKEYHDNARDTFQVFRFSVTQKSVEILKMCHGNLTNCSFEQSQSHEFPCTSYVSTSDLICALFWRAITRAHLKLFPDDPHTCMMLACDIRKRIGVSQAYCGNASFPLIMHMSKTAMMRQSITSTAMHIRHHIGLLSAGFVHQVMEFMATPQSMQYLMSMFHPTKSFFSASIINKFPMFDMLNFGFGKPVHVDIPAYLNPGFSIWMPTRSQSQPLYVNLSLNHKVFDIMQADSEFRHFVDI